jgi:hypothetical protein
MLLRLETRRDETRRRRRRWTLFGAASI